MRETDKFVFFWRGWPAQWFPSKFFDEAGTLYNCCEQYMMARKARLFEDREALQLIMEAASPREQQAIGRKVGSYSSALPFDDNVWRPMARKIVGAGNLLKFSQNFELRRLLLATDNKILVEASPTDKIWGIGMADDHPDVEDPAKWQGTNWLGESIMQVRKLFTDNGIVA